MSILIINESLFLGEDRKTSLRLRSLQDAFHLKLKAMSHHKMKLRALTNALLICILITLIILILTSCAPVKIVPPASCLNSEWIIKK